MKTILKSIGAGLGGILVGGIASTATDMLLERTGVLPSNNLYVAAWLIWIVLGYRFVYNILGCYVTAKLAPKNPMAHALTVGAIGVVACLAGTYANSVMNLGPMWYPITLTIISIPSGYLGGLLAKKF